MRKQQQVWLAEYTVDASIPAMNSQEPASGVVMFIDYLRSRIKIGGRAVDIGSGKGRNAVYLAEQGFEVYALEYIEAASAVARLLADARGVSQSIHFDTTEIDNDWRYANDFFSVAVDSFASIDIETRIGREKYRDEMYRTLKPGGYALVMAVSCDDEWEKELIAKYPGSEPHSTIWPQNGKFQKDYSESELREFYKMFEVVELRKVVKPSHKLGRNGQATNFWLVLHKPLTTPLDKHG